MNTSRLLAVTSLLQCLKERKLVQWALAEWAGCGFLQRQPRWSTIEDSVCRLVFVALGLSVLVACGRPSPLPNFTGTWRLDASRSVLQIPSPDSSVFSIEHRDPRFHLSRIHYFGEESDTFSIDLTTDGVEMEHSYPYFRLKGRAYWDGEVLVFDSELMMDGDSGTNVVRYSLADNGRTFIADEHQVMGQVSHENKWVFERR